MTTTITVRVSWRRSSKCQMMEKLQIRIVNVVQELTSTVKEGTPGADGSSKLSAEVKMKATLSDNVHDATLKNDGDVTYEVKATGLTKV